MAPSPAMTALCLAVLAFQLAAAAPGCERSASGAGGDVCLPGGGPPGAGAGWAEQGSADRFDLLQQRAKVKRREDTAGGRVAPVWEKAEEEAVKEEEKEEKEEEKEDRDEEEDAGDHDDEDKEDKEQLEKVLQKASEIAEASADRGEAQTIMRVRDTLEDDKVLGQDGSPDVAKNRDVIHDAIELLESRGNISVEEADAEGTLVTTDLLAMITGKSGMEESTDKNAVEGDMMATGPENKASLLEAAQTNRRWYGELWPKLKPIPYCFAPGTPPSVLEAFRDATKHFETSCHCPGQTPPNPCVFFEEVSSGGLSKYDEELCEKKPAIRVTSIANSCWSAVGNNGWVTPLNLGDGCDTMGIAAHEIGHAIGMAHEHSRPDRDSYVKLVWNNMQKDAGFNFNVRNKADTSVPYDFESLMHYGAKYFGKPGYGGDWYNLWHRRRWQKTTIQTKPEGHHIGNRDGLSKRDKEQLLKMYCP